MPMKVRYTVANGQILAEKRNGNYRFYRSDVLGSTVSLYDSNQTKTDSFTYWPYGETRTSSGSTGTKYKFVGTFGCRTQVDGGVYMRARVELPKDGRWMTVDPLWPSLPPYEYANSNPVTFTDVTGYGVGKRCVDLIGDINPPPKDYPSFLHCVLTGIRNCSKPCPPWEIARIVAQCATKWGIKLGKRELSLLACCYAFGKNGWTNCTETDNDAYNGCCHLYFCACMIPRIGDKWEAWAFVILPSSWFCDCIFKARDKCKMDTYIGPGDPWYGSEGGYRA